MPIYGLSERRQLPRLGKIRLGVMVESQGKRSHPEATDHFVVPAEVAAILPRDAQWCRCKHGEGPRQLGVLLPSDDPGEVFPQFLKMYRRSGLWCAGDGRSAKRWNDRGNLDDIACPCPFRESGECGEDATLNLFLPDVPGIGVYQIVTGNKRTIVGINSALDKFGPTFGGLMGIPFLLKLELQHGQRWDPARGQMVASDTYAMRLDSPYTLRQIVEWRRTTGARVAMALPPPPPGESTDHPALAAPTATIEEAESAEDISVCFAAASRLGVGAGAYERYYTVKYGHPPSDPGPGEEADQARLMRELDSDPDRASQFAAYCNAITDEKVREVLARSRQGKLL